MTTYTENYTQSIGGYSVNLLSNLVQRIRYWTNIQLLKNNVQQERQQLLEMSDAMLSDLGITWDQALVEARKTSMPVVRTGMLDRKVS